MSGVFLRRAGFVLALSIVATAARAAEDAGTRSVFATGAGVRPLALGGAYAAIADDVSGWMWNPAGLARLRQAEFQFNSVSLAELDVRETFGGIAVPSWRWGAAHLTYRQFAVDGVEGRDPRNFVTGEIGDRESELAVGYAQRFGEAWSVGVVAKTRHQDLAGRTANAVGADLGMLVNPAALGLGSRWARDLTFGLALHNVLEPALRLDLDEVGDPSALRVGVALQRPLFGTGALLAALDYEGVGGAGGALHAGLEFSPHPLMQLRTGLADGTFTAGSGFQFRDFSFDYAFQNGVLEETHRLGVTLRFGATVEESRVAAARARDQHLEDQLSAAFEKRNAERLAGLAAEARAALESGNFEAALERVATLRALDPTFPGARELEATVLIRRARRSEESRDPAAAMVDYRRALESAPGDTTATRGLERCEAETQRSTRRVAAIRNQFLAAVRAFAAGDLLTARAGFAEVLRLDPSDTEARGLLARAESALEARIESLAEETARLAAAGLIADAEASLQRARQLGPRHPAVERAAAALQRAREGAARAAASAPRPMPARSRPPLTAAEQRQAAELYAQGMEAFQKGRREQGLRYFELVYGIDPEHPGVVAGLKREYLTLGLESFAAGQLPESITLWEKALRLDPSDGRAGAYLLRAQQHLARSREIGGGR